MDGWEVDPATGTLGHIGRAALNQLLITDYPRDCSELRQKLVANAEAGRALVDAIGEGRRRVRRDDRAGPDPERAAPTRNVINGFAWVGDFGSVPEEGTYTSAEDDLWVTVTHWGDERAELVTADNESAGDIHIDFRANTCRIPEIHTIVLF